MRLASMSRTFALAISGFALLSTYAKADNFGFSFTESGVGTVSGVIMGLTNNSTGTATAVIIESMPAVFDADLGNPPINATLWSVAQDSFTETSGQITAMNFFAVEDADEIQLGLNDTEGYTYLNDDVGGHQVVGASGLSGLNLTPLTSTVPEPNSLLLLLTPLLLVALVAGRRIAHGT